MAKAKRSAKIETYEWLMGTGRNGARRIERLGWKRLSKIYYAKHSTTATKRAIIAECARCGYSPNMVLGLNS